MNNKPHADVLWQLLLYQSTAKVPRKYSFPLNRLLSASVYIFDSLHYKLRLEVSAVRYCWKCEYNSFHSQREFLTYNRMSTQESIIFIFLILGIFRRVIAYKGFEIKIYLSPT